MSDITRDTRKASSPAWYQIYLAAMMEHNQDKALVQIERAQRAIQDRLAELRSEAPSSPREVQDLTNALTYLGILLSHVGGESGSVLWD